MRANAMQPTSASAPLEDTHKPLTPPRAASASPTSPESPSPEVVRRLSMSGCSSPVNVSDAPSRSASLSPGVYCSQYRQQEYEEGLRNARYPTPPEAPRKDQYVPESELEGSSQSPLWQPPAKIFSNWTLHIHTKYKGPEPLTYVDTGLYEGGSNDYYEIFTDEDLCWGRRLNLVLKRHGIMRAAGIK